MLYLHCNCELTLVIEIMAETEQEWLQNEIAYFSAMIKNHTDSVQPDASSTDHSLRSSRNARFHNPNSGRYALVRNHPPNVQESGNNDHKPNPSKDILSRRMVLPKRSSQPRTVVLSGGSGQHSRRTVLKPSSVPQSNTSVPQSNKVNTSQNKRSVILKSQLEPAKHTVPNSQAHKTLQLGNSTTPTSIKAAAKIQTSPNQVSSKVSSVEASKTSKPECSKFVWVNKNILSNKTSSSSRVVKPLPAHPKTPEQGKLDSQYITKTKYKLTKVTLNGASNSKLEQGGKVKSASKNKLKALGKYKLVKAGSTGSGKRRISQRKMKIKAGLTPPYLSFSGKRLVSRFKIRRQSQEKRKAKALSVLSASPVLDKPRKPSSPYKVDHRKNIVLRSKYKIDKVKHSRKPSQRPSKKRRSLDKSNFRWVRSEMQDSYRTFVSPYKLYSRSYSSGDVTTPSSSRCADRNSVVRKLASRSLQKSAALSLRAKYKKNNTNDKQCLFYMRFGKCNRGDKCFYIHDPDRIAVCTRYLRGTCTIEDCPFSHEAKKEKVPVCQHFLRGCCLRDNCPYLHVNVGRDAPICKSFSELRYCHLGERCKKLHTDICPNRDEDGRCPKGSKCRLRHPKKISKHQVKKRYTAVTPQMSPEQLTDSLDRQDNVMVPHGEKLTKALPSYISLTKASIATADAERSLSREPKKLKTKPNFL